VLVSWGECGELASVQLALLLVLCCALAATSEPTVLLACRRNSGMLLPLPHPHCAV